MITRFSHEAVGYSSFDSMPEHIKQAYHRDFIIS